MAEPLEPLTQENVDDIDSALGDLANAREIIVRAKQAGIPIEELEKRANEAEQRLLRIKQAFTRGG